MLHAGRRKAGLTHPGLTIGTRIFEAALSFDQHVQAGQKAEGICSAIIVNNRIIGDDRPALRKRLKRLAEQRFLLAQIPIMQDVAHNDHVRFRQRVNEEVSSLEHDLVRETVASKLVCDPRHGAHVNGLLTVAEGIKSDSGLVRQ